jgi:acetolactate decarboxylase
MPRQTKPYRPLGEVAKTQPVFEFHDVRGALVGFRFPDYARGLNVPGYHLHFISDDRATGGHVLDCRTDGVTAEVDHTANLHLEMPEDAAFLAANLGEDKTETLKQVER